MTSTTQLVAGSSLTAESLLGMMLDMSYNLFPCGPTRANVFDCPGVCPVGQSLSFDSKYFTCNDGGYEFSIIGHLQKKISTCNFYNITTYIKNIKMVPRMLSTKSVMSPLVIVGLCAGIVIVGGVVVASFRYTPRVFYRYRS